MRNDDATLGGEEAYKISLALDQFFTDHQDDVVCMVVVAMLVDSWLHCLHEEHAWDRTQVVTYLQTDLCDCILDLTETYAPWTSPTLNEEEHLIAAERQFWTLVTPADLTEHPSHALWWLAAKQDPQAPPFARIMLRSGGNPLSQAGQERFDYWDAQQVVTFYAWARALPGWENDDAPIHLLGPFDHPIEKVTTETVSALLQELFARDPMLLEDDNDA